MNSDHQFYIGHDHKICQDYALSGVTQDGAYAIVSDGCSSSPDVDVGARLLALSAKRTLGVGGADMNYDLFGKVTIRNLEHIGDIVPLHPHSLDATLLAAWVKGKDFTAHMYGDGVFFHKSATALRIVHVEFESNKPAYLSYHLDKVRLKEYEDTVFGSKRIIDISLYRAGGEPRDVIETENYVKPFDPVSFAGIVDTDDIIGVISDGTNSFRKSDGSEIHWNEIIKELIDFKTTPGVFVQRVWDF
jgi:hypothetical protein